MVNKLQIRDLIEINIFFSVISSKPLTCNVNFILPLKKFNKTFKLNLDGIAPFRFTKRVQFCKRLKVK